MVFPPNLIGNDFYRGVSRVQHGIDFSIQVAFRAAPTGRSMAHGLSAGAGSTRFDECHLLAILKEIDRSTDTFRQVFLSNFQHSARGFVIRRCMGPCHKSVE
jgi:hypothetical protein